MPQEFVVLCCGKCDVYQVHQSKKATKWNCKVCGVKQSVKDFFGRGSGQECRNVVQRLNKGRFELETRGNGSVLQRLTSNHDGKGDSPFDDFNDEPPCKLPRTDDSSESDENARQLNFLGCHESFKTPSILSFENTLPKASKH